MRRDVPDCGRVWGWVYRTFSKQTKTSTKGKSYAGKHSNHGLPQGLAVVGFYVGTWNTDLIRRTTDVGKMRISEDGKCGMGRRWGLEGVWKGSYIFNFHTVRSVIMCQAEQPIISNVLLLVLLKWFWFLATLVDSRAEPCPSFCTIRPPSCALSDNN